MEYACPVFYDSLPNYPCENLEKHAFHVIYPTLSYAEVLKEANVESRFNGRKFLISTFFSEILNDDNNKIFLYHIIL